MQFQSDTALVQAQKACWHDDGIQWLKPSLYKTDSEVL